jgi:MFS family permease
MTANGTGRLLSVGLADLRGALHLGVDAASWLSTSYSAAMMFIGPFSVYLGGVLGARRVLLVCGALFTLVSILLPFASTLPIMLALLVLAGLAGGTFYPLTLTVVLRNLPMKYALLGIAVYSMDIVFTTNVATLGVQLGDTATQQRLFFLGGAMAPRSTGGNMVIGRALELLSLQVRQQAFTLAIADSFRLVAWSTVCSVIVLACTTRVPTQYRQVMATVGEA